MGFRMCFHTLGAHELQANSFSTKISDGFSCVLTTGNVVAEVVFHVVQTEGFVHSIINKNYMQLKWFLK